MIKRKTIKSKQRIILGDINEHICFTVKECKSALKKKISGDCVNGILKKTSNGRKEV